jgi:hypothetical protein
MVTRRINAKDIQHCPELKRALVILSQPVFTTHNIFYTLPPPNLEDSVVEIVFNPLNAELNPIRHLLALVGARHIVHVSRIRVNV